MKAYRIRNWSEHFETSDSRKRRGPLDWIAMPTQLSGKRFKRVARHERAPELFAAWCLILEVAARCPTRGLLVDEHGHALTPLDLSDLTGFPVPIFELALDVLRSLPGIEWIEFVEVPHGPHVPNGQEVPNVPCVPEAPGPCRDLPDHADACRTVPASAGKSRLQDRTEHGHNTNQPTKQDSTLVGGLVGIAPLLESAGIARPKAQEIARDHGLTSAQVVAHLAAIRRDPKIQSVPGILIHRLREKSDPLRKLVPADIPAAIEAGYVRKLRAPGGPLIECAGRKITHNDRGLYVDGDLMIRVDQLMEAEYA